MPALDGLRTLAVFAVIAYHFDFAWAGGGLLGVCLFFVLSGYLITDLLANEWDLTERIDLKNFWLRRARRLLPALFVMLAAVALWLMIFDPSRLPSYWQDELASIFYVSNWWFIYHEVSYFESFGPPSPLGHLWSLAVEEQFYIFWPLLIWLGFYAIRHKGRLALLTMVGVIVSALAMALIYQPGMDPNRVYYGTDTRAFSLLLGAALALVWPSRKLNRQISANFRRALDLCGLVALIIVLLLMWRTNQYQTSLYRGGLVLFSVASAVLIAVLAHPASRLGWLFGREPLRWLGVRSYGIYLWHFPVTVLTSPVVNTKGPELTLIFCQLAACLILAALSYRLVEEPIRYGVWKKPQLRPNYQKGGLWMSGKTASNVGFLILGLCCLSVIGVYLDKDKTGNLDSSVLASMPVLSSSSSAVTSSSVASVSLGFKSLKTGEDEWPIRPDANRDDTQEPVNENSEKPETNDSKDLETHNNSSSNNDSSNNGGSNNSSGIQEPNNSIEDNSVLDPELGQKVTVIGDSVMVGTEAGLKELLPGILVDAEVGRQMYQAPEVIQRLSSQGQLREYVVVELGTNGPFTDEQLKKVLDLLGPDKRIILVNTRVPRPWEGQVNQTLAKIVVDYPNAKLVDWYAASSGHDEYFYNDGVHLNPDGTKAYASLIAQAIKQD
ncbi:MAG: acetyltransferase [Peptococcaceae bacterium]|nr:acetyltransferase [Peptococcaceae bacterium]